MLLSLLAKTKTTAFTALTVASALAVAPVFVPALVPILAPIAPASAEEQNRGPNILRDTESEALLREYTRPVLRVAGLEKQNIQIVIINDPTFNAFVADGRRANTRCGQGVSW